MNRRTIMNRALPAAALALAAVLSTSGLALASDEKTGQTGNYIFVDDQTNFGMKCVHAKSAPWRLKKIVVQPPSLWWPDTNADNDKEHGKVGWRALVQISTAGAYGPWKTIKKSSVKKATAYEDKPPYDAKDKAKFKKRTLAINAKKYKNQPSTYARVVLKAFWYKPNGTTLGKVTHTHTYYKVKNLPSAPSVTTACAITPQS